VKKGITSQPCIAGPKFVRVAIKIENDWRP